MVLDGILTSQIEFKIKKVLVLYSKIVQGKQESVIFYFSIINLSGYNNDLIFDNIFAFWLKINYLNGIILLIQAIQDNW